MITDIDAISRVVLIVFLILLGLALLSSLMKIVLVVASIMLAFYIVSMILRGA
jgi:hypothetical protein